MGKKEAGRFRGKLFGGFNRKDVLAYIASVYSELEQAQIENEELRARCEEFEDGAQNRAATTPRPLVMQGSHPLAEEQDERAPTQSAASSVLDENTLATPEDLNVRSAAFAPPVQTAPPSIAPVPEKPHVKKSPAMPPPEQAKRVKVRPVRK